MSENSVGRMGVPPVHSCSARGGQAYPFWWPSALGGHLPSGVPAPSSPPPTLPCTLLVCQEGAAS